MIAAINVAMIITLRSALGLEKNILLLHTTPAKNFAKSVLVLYFLVN